MTGTGRPGVPGDQPTPASGAAAQLPSLPDADSWRGFAASPRVGVYGLPAQRAL